MLKRIIVTVLSIWIIACGGLSSPTSIPTTGTKEANSNQNKAIDKAQVAKPATKAKSESKTPKPTLKATSKPARKPPPAPKLPSCWDLRNDCDWDRRCASIGNSSERSDCTEGCEAWAEAQGCE